MHQRRIDYWNSKTKLKEGVVADSKLLIKEKLMFKNEILMKYKKFIAHNSCDNYVTSKRTKREKVQIISRPKMLEEILF